MKLFAIVAVLALAVTGCASIAGSGSDQSPAVESPVAQTQEPEATPEATEEDACGGTLEGCFTYNEMDDYVESITPMVAQYFQTEYEDVAAPRDIVYIPEGRAARSACGVSDSYAYEYCSGDQTIYIGQDLIWAFYQQAGDAAPAIALAHEWGHHLQSMLDVPYGRTQQQAIDFENQADCISGAWARYADDEGWLEDDDLDDANTLLELIGSAEGRSQDHGTTEERAEAFYSAYEDGIEACNAYSPDSPVA